MLQETLDDLVPEIANLVAFDLCSTLWAADEGFPLALLNGYRVEFLIENEIVLTSGIHLPQIDRKQFLVTSNTDHHASSQTVLTLGQIRTELHACVHGMHRDIT